MVEESTITSYPNSYRPNSGGGSFEVARYSKDQIILEWKEAMERGDSGSEIEAKIREISILRRWMEDVWCK
jgi:hypothetical protein